MNRLYDFGGTFLLIVLGFVLLFSIPVKQEPPPYDTKPYGQEECGCKKVEDFKSGERKEVNE